MHTLGICGANAGDWLKATPGTCGGAERRGTEKTVVLGGKAATLPISQLLATDKPDLVLIVMGDTMASYTKPAFPKAWLWQQTTALTKKSRPTAPVARGSARTGAPKAANTARPLPESR